MWIKMEHTGFGLVMNVKIKLNECFNATIMAGPGLNNL